MEKKLSIINQCLQGSLVKKGNRQRALNIYFQILDHIRCRLSNKISPLILILKVIENLRPSINLWPKKVGGTTYKIPYLISEKKGFKMVIHALLKEASGRSERSVKERIGNLILECAKGRNLTLKKKKEEIHKIGLSNRAFLKFK